MISSSVRHTAATLLFLAAAISFSSCSRHVTVSDPNTGAEFSYSVPAVFTEEEKEPGWLWTHAFYNEDWPLAIKCAYWIGPGH